MSTLTESLEFPRTLQLLDWFQFDCTLLGQYLFQPEHQHVRSITDVTLKLVVFSMQSLVLLHTQ